MLAEDVILIPTAAIEGSGSSASVQVLANGKTETRTISTGRQSGAQTEVVSGLSEGENVVYMQSFQGVPAAGRAACRSRSRAAARAATSPAGASSERPRRIRVCARGPGCVD